MFAKRRPDPAVSSFAAQAALLQLRRLTAEMAGVRLNEDVEAIHRSRVASRRLRAVLDTFQGSLPEKKAARWLKQVREITRSLGAARDTDVQMLFLEAQLHNQEDGLARWGIKRLLLRWRQKRDRLQSRVEKSLDDFEHSRAAVEMAAAFSPYTIYPTTALPNESAELCSLAGGQIQARLDAFLGLQDCLENVENQERLHAMRIAGKKLRYTIEIFAPLFEEKQVGQWLDELKRFQDLLGNIHDLDMWQEILPIAMAKEARKTEAYFGSLRPFARIQHGMNHFQEILRNQRAAEFAGLQEKWRKEKTQALWQEISSTASRLIPLDEVDPGDGQTKSPDRRNTD